VVVATRAVAEDAHIRDPYVPASAEEGCDWILGKFS
jgi:hypothetical protein